MSKIYPDRSGGLYRGLVVPLSAYVLIASLAMVVWITWLYRRESVRRLERLAETNAEFMEQVPLPKTVEMAEKLSIILGVQVGFYSPQGGVVRAGEAGWPNRLQDLLSTASGSVPASLEEGGYDLAIAPLQGGKQYLMLARPKEGGWSGLGGWVLAPTLVLTIACGGLVFLLAHRIVRPLTTLTRWLPNLKPDQESSEAIPTALSSRGDEIGILARSLEQTNQRLLREQELRQRSERLATLGRIATSLAHEIRNPAAAIRMHADLLAQPSHTDRDESIALIGEETDRITELVNQWLFVARASPPETRRHDLSELIGSVGRRLARALDHAGTRLSTTLARGAYVDCDRVRIEQVIRNLIVNAVQAMPEGGVVRAEVEMRDGHVQLTTSDTGSGFSEEALRRFGEPFFSEREGGMGIGLTLAREVTEAHGGTIVASNPPSGGASVRIRLPFANATDE